MPVRGGALVGALAALAACGEDLVVRGDPTYPIPMRRDAVTGVPLTLAELGPDPEHRTEPFPIVLDTGTPLSAIWPGVSPDAAMEPRCGRYEPLRILTGAATDPIARVSLTFDGRFRYWCTPAGQVGLGAMTTPIGGVIGGDILSRFSVRFTPRGGPAGEPTLQLFEDLFERSEQLAVDGNVVLSVQVTGGGTLLGSDGVQHSFARSRVAMRSCLAPLPFDPAAGVALGQPPGDLGESRATGAPMLLLLATGAPVTVISQAAYDRLVAQAAAEPDAPRQIPLVPAAPEDVLYLPGVTHKSLDVLERTPMPTPVRGWVEPGLLALVARDRVSGDEEKDPEVDPCRELARARSLTQLAISLPGPVELPRPAAAHLEIVPPRPIAVVGDDAPFLVSARLEAGTRTAVIDGVLGADVLGKLEFEVGYAARDEEPSRVVLRCPAGEAGCVARPRCTVERAEERSCPERPPVMPSPE